MLCSVFSVKMAEEYSVPSVSDMTLDRLQNIDDCDEAFDIGETWDVNLSGCEDIEELKDRLIYYWKTENGTEEGLTKVDIY